MLLIFGSPAAAWKVTTMAAMPGVELRQGQQVDVPAGLVEACLRSGLFHVPDELPAPASIGRVARDSRRGRRDRTAPMTGADS